MWFKHPFSRRLFAFLWGSTAALVISVALLVSIARLLLPLLDQYRVQVEALASEQLGRPVRIGAITAGWQGMEPDLRLQDVTVLAKDGSSTWLTMAEVRASLDLFDTLRNGRLETGTISLVGGSLDVVRHEDGSYSVAGVATGSGGVAGHGGRRLLQWLMARDRVRLQGATLRWRDARISSQPLQIAQLSLDLRRVGERYRLGGIGKLGGDSDAELQFALDLAGDPEQPQSLRSALYMAGHVELGEWLNGTAFKGVQRLGGAVDFELWADGADRLEQLRAAVQGRELVWQPAITPEAAGPVAPLQLDQASTTVFWKASPQQGWRLALEDLQIVRGHRSWPASSVEVLHTGAGREAGWEARASFVRLEDLNAALVTWPDLPLDVRDAANALDPRGDVRNLAIRFQADAPERSFVAAKVQDLSFRPWEKVPGVEGIDGDLRMNRTQGSFSLDSGSVAFIYPRLFREPIRAQHVGGALYWHHDAEGLHLYAPRIGASNSDIAADGRLAMDLPGSGASPFLDLQVDFRNGTASAAPRYYPVGIMPPQVVEWLDAGIVDGRVPYGRALFYGRLKEFPFVADEGTFRVDFAVEDAILDYAPAWPRLEEAAATVRFSDRSMRAEIYSGKMLNLDIGRSRVEIPNLEHDAVLAVRAQARAPLQNFLTYLKQGPLGADSPAILEQLQARNPARTQVTVNLPLHKHGKPQVRGDLRFEDNQLIWPQWDVNFEALQGRLGFQYRDSKLLFDAEDLRLRWRTAPATMQVHTSTVANETQVRLDLHTRNDVPSLLGAHGNAVDPLFSGAADWNLRATVHRPDDESRPTTVDLQARSNLEGVEVKLPEPLRKTAPASRQVLALAKLDEQGVRELQFFYGTVLNGVVALRNGGIRRGEFRLGAAQAIMPETDQLRVVGAIGKLSLSDWADWLHGRSADSAGPPSSTAGVPWRERVDVVNVRVGELEVLQHQLHDLHLDARRSASSWQADVDAQEIVGQIQLPGRPTTAQPVTAQLTRLHWPSAQPEQAQEGAITSDPGKLPPMLIDVEQLAYGETELGRFHLRADSIPGGVEIKQATITGDFLAVDASGKWRAGPRGPVCEFSVDASTENLGKALEQSGFTGTVEKGKAALQIQATWPGSPADFALKHLDGNVRLQVTDGQLLALDPKGGRIFGLLSLQALPRRLSLDFSDLFKKGFAFDRIQGAFTISDGDAYTNDLYMEGPAARVDVAGRIGLAAEDYDQTALVTPRVSASIPVVGGLAGGPAVGLGLWVAERMFGKKIDELSRIRYNITGSWADPVVTRADEAG